MKPMAAALPALGAAALVALGVALPGPGRADPPQGQAMTTPVPPPGAMKALSPAERVAVEAVVRRYILDHPEIIPEAITALQTGSVRKYIAANRSEIETPFGSAWAGAKNGDVTLVEFYDYACPYCQQAKADVERLVRDDPRVKVVYRDYPVIAEASREAALASLSAAAQGRHGAFYDRMYGTSGRLSHEKVVATVRAAGLDELKTARDLQAKANAAEIEKNIEMGRALGMNGTPSYVIGDKVLVGAVGFDALKAAVAEARDRRG